MSGKKPDIVLILSVLFACVIVAGTIIYVSLQQARTASPPDSSAAAAVSSTGEIAIPDLLAACKTGDSCIVIDTSCGFCCKYIAINAIHEKLFDDMFNNGCSGFKGAVCQCFDLGSYPACVNGKCQLVKFDEEQPQTKP